MNSAATVIGEGDKLINVVLLNGERLNVRVQMESTSSWTSTKNYQSLQSLLHISGKTTFRAIHRWFLRSSSV